jgi:hypothetical protein
MLNTRVALGRLATAGALAATLVVAGPVSAQDASPMAEEAVVCMAEPRDVEEIVAFYFDPAGTPLATPTATTVETEAELPPGDPVAAEIEAAVNAVFAEMFACFEVGQYARGFALMTDDLARQTGPDVTNPDEDTPEEVRALLEAQLAGTPVADEPGMEQMEPTDIGQGRDLRTLEGGRVGGVWVIEGDAAFVVFEQDGDVWLVDELIDIVDDEMAVAGTPAP